MLVLITARLYFRTDKLFVEIRVKLSKFAAHILVLSRSPEEVNAADNPTLYDGAQTSLGRWGVLLWPVWYGRTVRTSDLACGEVHCMFQWQQRNWENDSTIIQKVLNCFSLCIFVYISHNSLEKLEKWYFAYGIEFEQWPLWFRALNNLGKLSPVLGGGIDSFFGGVEKFPGDIE